MSPVTASPPTAQLITLSASRQLLSLYDKVVKLAYKANTEKIYKPKLDNNEERYSAALKAETWRYEELPAQFEETQSTDSQGKGLNLSELEKLTTWKITHGRFRPFLLSQIRKNTSEQVSEATRKSRHLLLASTKNLQATDMPSDEALKEALDAVCVLKGVGPATGSLILSIFSPDNAPFFEDDLYRWFTSERGEIRYTVKEYFVLVKGVRDLKRRLGGDEGLKVWEMEKLGFVVGHWVWLDEDDKQKVWSYMDETGADKQSLSDKDDTSVNKRKAADVSADEATPAPKKSKAKD